MIFYVAPKEEGGKDTNSGLSAADPLLTLERAKQNADWWAGDEIWEKVGDGYERKWGGPRV